jgi:hypothetical protein
MTSDFKRAFNAGRDAYEQRSERASPNVWWVVISIILGIAAIEMFHLPRYLRFVWAGAVVIVAVAAYTKFKNRNS